MRCQFAPAQLRLEGIQEIVLERRIEQKLDASGRSKDEAVKVFEVYPGLPGEDRYRRLIEEDGKPVSADKLARQDRGRLKDVEAYAQKLSNAAERDKAARQDLESDDPKVRRQPGAHEDVYLVPRHAWFAGRKPTLAYRFNQKPQIHARHDPRQNWKRKSNNFHATSSLQTNTTFEST